MRRRRLKLILLFRSVVLRRRNCQMAFGLTLLNFATERTH